jgi:hypothetical protein
MVTANGQQALATPLIASHPLMSLTIRMDHCSVVARAQSQFLTVTSS